jgi:hypothetical protein
MKFEVDDFDVRREVVRAFQSVPNSVRVSYLKPGEPIFVNGVAVATDVPGDRFQSTEDRCTEIADQVVPQYRDDNQRQPGYSCTGIYAKRWQAAWDAACIALGGDPAEYRR